LRKATRATATRSPAAPAPRRRRARAARACDTHDHWRTRSTSAAETHRLGRVIGLSLSAGDVLALSGTLGSGKTCFIRGVADGLDAPPDRVSSPTFTLVHEYRGRLPLIHADLYRLERPGDIASVGLGDYFDGSGAVAVEWADRPGADLPADRLDIHLTHRTRHSRLITMRSTGPASRRLLHRARQRWRRAAVARS
jgi:tRNA threonylcarbamoyladenosine biosynthesis protein TsaE